MAIKGSNWNFPWKLEDKDGHAGEDVLTQYLSGNH
jgi:hypothetical protein